MAEQIGSRSVGTGGADDDTAGPQGSDASGPDLIDLLATFAALAVWLARGMLAEDAHAAPRRVPTRRERRLPEAPRRLIESSPRMTPAGQSNGKLFTFEVKGFTVNDSCRTSKKRPLRSSEDHTRNFVICKKDRGAATRASLEPRFPV